MPTTLEHECSFSLQYLRHHIRAIFVGMDLLKLYSTYVVDNETYFATLIVMTLRPLHKS